MKTTTQQHLAYRAASPPQRASHASIETSLKNGDQLFFNLHNLYILYTAFLYG